MSEDSMSSLVGAEQWARAHVRLFAAEQHGKAAITWAARIDLDGQVFERRERGDFRRGEALRQRATEAVVRDYLDWVERCWLG
jgi:hypothetical protein